MAKKSKYDRILSIYTELNSGNILNKAHAAESFGVNERTIQRDIDDIRAFFEENTLGYGYGKSVVYDRAAGGYRIMDEANDLFTKSEILAVCKILLDSRSLTKEEMLPIINKLLQHCLLDDNRKKVRELINNELYHYIEPLHGVNFVEKLWDIGMAVREKRIIEVEYTRLKDKALVHRRLKPAGIMVSDFYFYLTAFIDDIDKGEHFENPDDLFPTIYRIDRFVTMKITDEHFRVPYAEKFEEGEFRKRVQFMYGGKLQTIRFRFSGLSIEAVLDRLPTAKILEEGEGWYIVEAEVFGKGIDMWLRSQGDFVEVLEEGEHHGYCNQKISAITK